MDRELIQYKIVVSIFGAAYAALQHLLHQIKAQQFYTHFPVLIMNVSIIPE